MTVNGPSSSSQNSVQPGAEAPAAHTLPVTHEGHDRAGGSETAIGVGGGRFGGLNLNQLRESVSQAAVGGDVVALRSVLSDAGVKDLKELVGWG